MVGLAVPYDTPVKGILKGLNLDQNHHLYFSVGEIQSHGLGLGIDEILLVCILLLYSGSCCSGKSPHLQSFYFSYH